MSKFAKKKLEERVYFDTKYGPLHIVQNGKAVKELTVTKNEKANGPVYALDNFRLSLHLERFQGIEPFLESLQCKMRLPEFNYEISFDAACSMKVGFTHGASVITGEHVPLDIANLHSTEMELEYFLGDTSQAKVSVPVAVPEQVN